MLKLKVTPVAREIHGVIPCPVTPSRPQEPRRVHRPRLGVDGYWCRVGRPGTSSRAAQRTNSIS